MSCIATANIKCSLETGKYSKIKSILITVNLTECQRSTFFCLIRRPCTLQITMKTQMFPDRYSYPCEESPVSRPEKGGVPSVGVMGNCISMAPCEQSGTVPTADYYSSLNIPSAFTHQPKNVFQRTFLRASLSVINGHLKWFELKTELFFCELNKK